MEKFIKDGQVAVLYSPGYGAGWSTWAYEGREALVFDVDIVKAVLNNDVKLAKEIAERKYPEQYNGGIDELVVGWVPQGEEFDIREYDGNESLQIIGKSSFFVA